MGILLCNIILILVSVFHYVILPTSVLGHDNQDRQIKDESRSSFSDPFKIVNNSLPFNKYAFLTTHKAYSSRSFYYSIKGRFQVAKESKDSVAQQLNSGVRALMLHINKYKNSEETWLCHQECEGAAQEWLKLPSPALDLFQELEEFLTSNPSEVITLFFEDNLQTPNGLSKILNVSGLAKYMLPLSKMPRDGGDWPIVKDMVAANQRLVVFSSAETKEESEGIGYQGNFVVEYPYGGQETGPWTCAERNDTSPSPKRSRSLMLLNYLPSPSHRRYYYEQSSKDLIMDAIRQCHKIDSDHGWANFIDVMYGEGIDVGPAFEAVDFLNGKLLCGCNDVNSCRDGSRCLLEDEFDAKTKVFGGAKTKVEFGAKTNEEFGGAKTKVEFGAKTNEEFGGAKTKGEFGGAKTKVEFGVKTKVIALLFVCAVLGYSLYVVRYIKKKKKIYIEKDRYS